MAENIPNIPTGAVPPKKETGKVQPKKETVRINLPPKPSAAPTIKLPTLPPGGPLAGSAVTTAAAPTAGAGTPQPAGAQTRAAAAPVAAQRPTTAPRPTMVPRPVPALSAADTGLAIGAMVAGLVAVGSVLYLLLVVIS